MHRVLAVCIVGVAAILASCVKAPNPGDPENIETRTASSVYPNPCTPLSYGNDVLYFPCKGADFGNELSRYREQHPDLRIAAMTGDGNGGYGRDRGYFVTVEPKT